MGRTRIIIINPIYAITMPKLVHGHKSSCEDINMMHERPCAVSTEEIINLRKSITISAMRRNAFEQLRQRQKIEDIRKSNTEKENDKCVEERTNIRNSHTTSSESL